MFQHDKKDKIFYFTGIYLSLRDSDAMLLYTYE